VVDQDGEAAANCGAAAIISSINTLHNCQLKPRPLNIPTNARPILHSWTAINRRRFVAKGIDKEEDAFLPDLRSCSLMRSYMLSQMLPDHIRF
jgi:hypothetical protein